MASSKEMQQTSRPLTHRPPISSNSNVAGLPGRQSHSRNNSHSILGSSLNATHRITRRKSMTNTAANVAAVAAVMGEVVAEGMDKAMALPITINSGRRNTMSKSGISRAMLAASLPSQPPVAEAGTVKAEGKPEGQDSAIDDGASTDGETTLQDGRLRRASDGQPLAKEGNSKKMNRVELRCEKCGKGYKHSSCLTKHLWEHTPEWSLTSKLLISKHQQVQLLEAASVLVTMNNGLNASASPPDSTRDFFASDQDSASPTASGYSDIHNDRSSADTTPPPHMDAMSTTDGSYRSTSKRDSSGSVFSRSYQSAPSASSLASSAPNGFAFNYGHFRQLSHEHRPTSSGKNATGQDDQELAAAVELLSCSFGSNNGTRSMQLPYDAPPVPPVPSQYLDQVTGSSFMTAGTSFISSFPRGAPMSFERGGGKSAMPRRDGAIKTEESGDSVMGDDDDDYMRSRARSDEDEEGVFGRMEE
ncbi:hypothetical protein RB594_003011 [Gaeumannomyces avenae]